MPDDVIHSFAEGTVGGRFKVERPILPMAKSGKGFHMHALVAIDMGGTGGFFDDPKLASFLPEGPELASHFVYRAEGFECIDRDLMNGWAGATCFGLDAKASPVGGFACCAIIGIYEKVTQHSSIVIKEAGSNVLVFYRTSGQGGKEGCHIIMAIFPELFYEVRCPGGSSYFIARQVELFQGGLF